MREATEGRDDLSAIFENTQDLMNNEIKIRKPK